VSAATRQEREGRDGSLLHFTRNDLREATDDGSWRRGVGYFEGRRVGALRVGGGSIQAPVNGTRVYDVRLWMQAGQIEGDCSCPMGDNGVFCKHCVAVGLTYLRDRPEGDDDTEAPAEPPAPQRKGLPMDVDAARAYLTGLKKSALVEMLMGRLPGDEEFRQELLGRIARRDAGGPDISAYRKAITDATRIRGGFVDWRSAPRFARRIEVAIDALQKLLDEGHAEEAIGLIEHAVARCGNACHHMDDSDGCMGDILYRLAEMHHAACHVTKPRPDKLAYKLLRWELEGPGDAFYEAASRYADVLGEKGLAAYRRLVQKEWDKLPSRTPEDSPYDGETGRYTLTAIMKSLARASGDTEALISVLSKDLSSPARFLDLAQACREAGQRSEAMQWALRGLESFPEPPDDSLVEFVADEYHHLEDHDKAVSLLWEQYQRRMDLRAYACLKKHADRVGQWNAWRTKALEWTHKKIGDAMRQPRRTDPWTYRAPPDHSLLVEIFLWEDDPESAWQEAQMGGCSDPLWMTLAESREKDHPADAVTIYRERIDPIVTCVNKEAYRKAAGLIRKIQHLMSRLGHDEQFADYLATVRHTHKRKRNFIAMLAEL